MRSAPPDRSRGHARGRAAPDEPPERLGGRVETTLARSQMPPRASSPGSPTSSPTPSARALRDPRQLGAPDRRGRRGTVAGTALVVIEVRCRCRGGEGLRGVGREIRARPERASALDLGPATGPQDEEDGRGGPAGRGLGSSRFFAGLSPPAWVWLRLRAGLGLTRRLGSTLRALARGRFRAGLPRLARLRPLGEPGQGTVDERRPSPRTPRIRCRTLSLSPSGIASSRSPIPRSSRRTPRPRRAGRRARGRGPSAAATVRRARGPAGRVTR